MPDPKKVLCPECEAENLETAEVCTKCGFRLEGFEGFYRWSEAAEKRKAAKIAANKAEADRKAAEEKDKTKKKSGFGIFGGL